MGHRAMETKRLPRVSKLFQDIPMACGTFRGLSMCSKTFQGLAINSGSCRGLPRASKCFQDLAWEVDDFQDFLKASKACQGLPPSCKAAEYPSKVLSARLCRASQDFPSPLRATQALAWPFKASVQLQTQRVLLGRILLISNWPLCRKRHGWVVNRACSEAAFPLKARTS